MWLRVCGEEVAVTTLMELVGFVLITVGCWMVAEPLGLIVGGLLLVGVAYLFDRGRQ